jgi:hypothetical protein
MAFTFLVEDGTGLSGATSYASVAEANSYLAQNIHVQPTWRSLATSQKEALLSWSSRYLDQRATWNGTKSVETSALRWPRTGVYDVDGNAIDSDVIPQALKSATIEMARYLIAQDRSDDRDQDALKELQVDVIRLVFDETYRLPEVPNEIQFILRGLGTIQAGRLQFAKIMKV